MSHWYVIRTHAKAEFDALSNVLRQGFNAVLLTDIKSAQAAYEALRRYLPGTASWPPNCCAWRTGQARPAYETLVCRLYTDPGAASRSGISQPGFPR